MSELRQDRCLPFSAASSAPVPVSGGNILPPLIDSPSDKHICFSTSLSYAYSPGDKLIIWRGRNIHKDAHPSLVQHQLCPDLSQTTKTFSSTPVPTSTFISQSLGKLLWHHSVLLSTSSHIGSLWEATYFRRKPKVSFYICRCVCLSLHLSTSNTFSALQLLFSSSFLIITPALSIILHPSRFPLHLLSIFPPHQHLAVTPPPITDALKASCAIMPGSCRNSRASGTKISSPPMQARRWDDKSFDDEPFFSDESKAMVLYDRNQDYQPLRSLESELASK